jgi:hypothetical protein
MNDVLLCFDQSPWESPRLCGNQVAWEVEVCGRWAVMAHKLEGDLLDTPVRTCPNERLLSEVCRTPSFRGPYYTAMLREVLTRCVVKCCVDHFDINMLSKACRWGRQLERQHHLLQSHGPKPKRPPKVAQHTESSPMHLNLDAM